MMTPQHKEEEANSTGNLSNKKSWTGKSSLFRRPSKQRLHWGDDHVLPHVNWGDLFFDLFYVVSTVIK